MAVWKRLASQSAILFAARLFGAGLTFVAQAAVARAFGSTVLGSYLLVMATVNLIAVVMPLGFETIGTYFAAEYRAKGEGRLLRGFLLRAYGHVAAMTVLLLVIAAPAAGLFGVPGRVFASHWLPASILAFSTALIFVSGAILIGLKRPYAGLLADTIFRPIMVFAGFLIGLAASAEAHFDYLVWGVAGGITVVALAQFAYLMLRLREVPSEVAARSGEVRRWWRFATPWVVITLATEFFFDLDLLVLSNLLSREELAIFGVCTRFFSLVAFGVGVVYSVTMPEMLESEARADRIGFHRKVGEANVVASGLSVLLFCLVAGGAPFALMLFGPAFEAGAAPLAVLCLALVMRSVFGPTSIVLSVHDKPHATLPAIGLGVVTLIGGNLLLVPRLGLMGAAIAALLSITLWSAAQWYTVLKIAGVDVSIRAWLVRAALVVPAE